MQFFKHYHNASTSLKLQKLLDKKGVEGYGRYWLLLELLCEKFDGENSRIDLHLSEISTRVRLKYSKSVDTFIQELVKSELILVKFSEKVYQIEAPILFDLQAKDFKYATRLRLSSDPKNKSKDKRIKNKDKRIKNKEKIVANFDLESIYAMYPKKEGKQKGLEKLKREIKTDQDFQDLLKAVKNYSQKCLDENTEQKYIKHFASFVSAWRDYLEYTPVRQISKTQNHFQELLKANPYREEASA